MSLHISIASQEFLCSERNKRIKNDERSKKNEIKIGTKEEGEERRRRKEF